MLQFKAKRIHHGREKEKMQIQVFLTLEQHVKVVSQLEACTSCRQIAKQFGVGKTQIQNLLQWKAQILTDCVKCKFFSEN